MKQALELYLEQNHNIHSTEWNDLNEVCRNALIIEFFDSVGIYCNTPHLDNFFSSFTNNDWNGDFSTRTEATNEAIIKANDLFNEK